MEKDNLEFYIDTTGRPKLSRAGKEVEISNASASASQDKFVKFRDKFVKSEDLKNITLTDDMAEALFEVLDSVQQGKAIAEKDEALLKDLRESMLLRMGYRKGGKYKPDERGFINEIQDINKNWS